MYSNTFEEHFTHVFIVLERLRKHLLFASPKKCSFMQADTEFLGIFFGHDGIGVHPQKDSMIQNLFRPMNFTNLHSFLGLVQFFRHFNANFP